MGAVSGSVWTPAHVAKLVQQSEQGAIIDRTTNTITYPSMQDLLVPLAAPAALHSKGMQWEIDGLINPKVVVPQGAQITVDVVNADQGYMHGFEVTTARPPFWGDGHDARTCRILGGLYYANFTGDEPRTISSEHTIYCHQGGNLLLHLSRARACGARHGRPACGVLTRPVGFQRPLSRDPLRTCGQLSDSRTARLAQREERREMLKGRGPRASNIHGGTRWSSRGERLGNSGGTLTPSSPRSTIVSWTLHKTIK